VTRTRFFPAHRNEAGEGAVWRQLHVGGEVAGGEVGEDEILDVRERDALQQHPMSPGFWTGVVRPSVARAISVNATGY
jgi:hypothetical protein